jgi:F0F1-type ATP synthase membrane subunit c/vacuolar-type H+-ATPase subunit K
MDTPAPLPVDAMARVTTAICFAILASIPLYVAIAWIVVGQGAGVSGAALPPVLKWALGAVGLVMLVVAQAVWVAMKRSAAAQPTAAGRLAAYRTAAIVSFALREAAAIVGLVIAMLTGDLRWCLALAAAALLAMLLGWPRRTDMQRLAGDPAAAPIG